MRLARIRTDDGVVSGEYVDGVVETDTETYTVGEDGPLCAPCEPSVLYCVGRNYTETLDQMDYDRPEQPDWFLKQAGAVHPPGAPIAYPDWTEELTYAGELAAVIDRRCSDLAPTDVDDVIRGYTIMNDLDALDQPGRTARKAFTGSAPLGPWIETELEPTAIEMTTHINGEQRQAANTQQMIFPPRELIAALSERYTFTPGDVIAFGSPANPGTIGPGDTIEIWYEGIGTLTNTVSGSN